MDMTPEIIKQRIKELQADREKVIRKLKIRDRELRLMEAGLQSLPLERDFYEGRKDHHTVKSEAFESGDAMLQQVIKTMTAKEEEEDDE